MQQNVIKKHFEVGEKYLEFLRSPYVDTWAVSKTDIHWPEMSQDT